MSEIEVGSKVRCVDNELVESSLTLGKVYEVLGIVKIGFDIIDDEGFPYEFARGRFELVDEQHRDQHSSIEKLYKDNFQTYLSKNNKYGNSFQDTFRELGQISALTRMSDKFNRIKTMMLNDITDETESLEDDLLDLANYAIMTVYELQRKKENK